MNMPRLSKTNWMIILGIVILILIGICISQTLYLPSPSYDSAPEMMATPLFNATDTLRPLGHWEQSKEAILLTNKTQPLPHDGLFIRRHNEFGTRLTAGIKELIEQGIIIDQTEIRFDDFVALNTDQIPFPEYDRSMAINYGVSEIPPSQKRDERATHYLEIALKTADKAPVAHPESQAPPVNYIFVVDTSGSMAGEKLDAVKSSIRELFSIMTDKDVIGIIEFNDQPKTVFKAKAKGDIDVGEFSRKISDLLADGGTDINIGLLFGVDEISRFRSNNTLNHVFLFTDGNPTSGEGNWLKIRQNVSARMRDDTRLSVFAFGSDANIRELDALAGVAGGRFTFVRDSSDIQFNLNDELNRREHLAAINIQMKIEIDRDISIIYLYGHDEIKDPARRVAVLQDVELAKEKAEEEFEISSQSDIITDETGIRIFVPDLAVGETYWVVFELAIPEEKALASLGQATIQHVDTFARENRREEFQLSSPGTLPSELVVQHALGLWTSEVIFRAIDDLYEQDVETAKSRIGNHISVLNTANNDLSSEQITDDIITLRKFVSLSENLGQMRRSSDYPTGEPEVFLFHSLSSFGRVRYGFNRVSYAPNR